MLVDYPNNCEFSSGKFKHGGLTTVVGSNLIIRESYTLHLHSAKGTQVGMHNHVLFEQTHWKIKIIYLKTIAHVKTKLFHDHFSFSNFTYSNSTTTKAYIEMVSLFWKVTYQNHISKCVISILIRRHYNTNKRKISQ